MKTTCKMTYSGEPALVVDCLAKETAILKSKIKDAMVKGAVWLKTISETKEIPTLSTDLTGKPLVS